MLHKSSNDEKLEALVSTISGRWTWFLWKNSPIKTAGIGISWSPLMYFHGSSVFNKSNQNPRQQWRKLFARCSPRGLVSFSSKIWMDQGFEFRGDFKELCNQNHIETYHTFNESKTSRAERCIRTIQTILYKNFEESGSYKYINFIQKLVKLLYARINRSIGMAPVSVRGRDTKKLLQKLNAETVAPWRPS